MLDDVVPYLACPYCGAGLTRRERTLYCPERHAFDIARQGYVNLLPGDARPGAGDTLAMVEARKRFLAAGHYVGVSAELARSAAAHCSSDGCVVDAGAGTGHHLACVLDRLPDRTGLALDRSKYAVRRAARAHPRAGAAACDSWRGLPVRDGCAAVVLDVFAPRNGAEFRRILRDDGVLVVVTPTPGHLRELVDALGLLTVDAAKESRVSSSLGSALRLVESSPYEGALSLSRSDAYAVAAMGPSAYHMSSAELECRVAQLPEPIAVTVSVTITAYRPSNHSPGPGT